MNDDNAQCVLCEEYLEGMYFIRIPGKKYQSAFICVNNNCSRYGLLTVLKLLKPYGKK